VLIRFAESSTDDTEASRALCRAGEIAGWQLDKLDDAAALLELSIERRREGNDAVFSLLRIRTRQGRWQDAATLLEHVKDNSEGQARAALLWQLARLREFRLGQTPDVALYEEAAADLDSELGSELLRVERLASEGVAPESLARRLEELAKQTADDSLAAAYLLDAAHAREFTGTAESPDSSIAEAYQRRPDDLPTLWAYERNLRQKSAWSDLAELYDREAQMELDRSVRVQRLAATADAFWRAGDLEATERICRECLNFDAHCLPALRLLAQVAEQSERWNQLAELNDRLAEACTDPNNRRDSCLLAAELWLEKLDEPSRALASLAVLLADDPGQPEAFRRAEKLMRSRGEFSELSRLYQRRIRACKDDAEKIVLLRDHARLMRESLGQPDRAIADLNELLGLLPDDVQTLSDLADLHGQQNHWSDAASALGLLIDRGHDAEVRHAGRLRLADLWLRRLHEPRRARAVLEAAADERPDDIEVHKLQVRLATTVGDWSDARTLLDQVASGTDSATQVWAKLQQAEVARLGMRDSDQADSYTGEAIAIAAESEQALSALRDHFESGDDRKRLCEICEKLLGKSSAGAAKALRGMLSRIYLDDLDRPGQALPHLEALLADDPESKDLALLLARALEKAGKDADAATRYRALLKEDASELEAYRGLARAGQPQVVTAAATLVDLLGDVGEKEAALLKLLEEPATPRGAFSSAQLKPSAGDREIDELLETMQPYLAEVLELSDEGELLGSTDLAVSAAQTVARAFGISGLAVKRVKGDEAQVIIGDPIVLRLGASLVEQAGKPAFLFWTARALARSLGGGLLLHSLDEGAVEDFISAVYDKRPDSHQAQQTKKAISRQLPRKIRKQVEQLNRPDGASWRKYRASVGRLADRLALVLSRNPGAALASLARSRGVSIDAIGRDKELSGLMRFVVSASFATLHQTIWG